MTSFRFNKDKSTQFTERDVNVLFDVDWRVIKLDEHRYYKRLSGQGIRGVDFMSVHPIFGLVLIELKSYTNGENSIPEGLDGVMLEKQKDTLRLIRIINSYYQRQFYFRLLKKMNWNYLYPDEWKIWIQADEHIKNGNFFFLGIVYY